MVVVASVSPNDANCVQYVNTLAVPLSFILTMNICPFVGVPDGLLNRRAPACAVISYISVIPQSIVVEVVYEAADTIFFELSYTVMSGELTVGRLLKVHILL